MREEIVNSARRLFSNWISPTVLSDHSNGERAAENIIQVQAGLQTYCNEPVTLEDACEALNTYLRDEVEIPNARLGVYARSYRWSVVDGVVRCEPFANQAPKDDLEMVATC